MILYRQKFFDALDDELEEMEREEREERDKIDRERKRNIANRTKYNTFLSKYKSSGTSWGRDEAKKKAKELDKLGYSDEDILRESTSVVPLISDGTVRGGAALGGLVGVIADVNSRYYKKLPKALKYISYIPGIPLLYEAIGTGVGAGIGAVGGKLLRKDAVKELLDRRRRDEDKNRIK
jgi:hypothetical protein